MASRKRAPFWEKLSVETMATGAAPALKRASSSEATMPMVEAACAGPAASSSATLRNSSPAASRRP